MDFYAEVNLNEDQNEALARGLFAVARADGGIHEREKALLASFFDEGSPTSPSALSQLEGAPDISPEALALALGSGPPAEMFVKTAILLAYADNDYSAAERATIERYAGAVGIDAAGVATLEQGVRDYLMSHLLGLSNVEAVADVAKTLG